MVKEKPHGCSDCDYMLNLKLKTMEDVGMFCGRYPPTIVRESSQLKSRFPLVFDNMKCGEWKPINK